ncbi:MAG: hypothetical protein M1829_002939 [Trizodia sp. TS-e1964]|nr:MAG: hypothetical protein M1829_002939 [Trizodia sp. TS-e1964]
MSLKQEIETWVQALAHYDNNEFEEALRSFDAISDTSKILFNCGVIHATLGEHQKAVQYYQKAVALDKYLAIAYFQQGVSNFLIGDFEEALANFNDTLYYLRGNTLINYDQLGLKFKLYPCEVLFNRGLCYIYLQQKEAGMEDLSFAVKEKVVEEHNVIDDAIREEADGYTVFSIPVGLLYRPHEAKVKNLKTKDYLGKAHLVASSERSNAFTGFTGQEVKNMALADRGKDDRPSEGISFAASNLVKPGLKSRSRQQSEPPISRNVFPPTPPPEHEKPGSGVGSNISAEQPLALRRSSSFRSGSSRNDPDSDPRQEMRQELRRDPRHDSDLSIREKKVPVRERPRLGTIRTASEPRGPSRNYSHARPESQVSRLRETPESASRRRRDEDDGEETDQYPDELYDKYQRSTRTSAIGRRGSSKSRHRHELIEEEREEEEEEEEAGSASDYGGSSLGEDDFEMLSSTRAPRRAPSRARTASKRPDIRKIRAKVHGEDTRYIMINVATEFSELVDRVREKFSLTEKFKIMMREEDLPDGDMITMADQDDLDVAITNSKANAKKDKADMGKMELWIK